MGLTMPEKKVFPRCCNGKLNLVASVNAQGIHNADEPPGISGV